MLALRPVAVLLGVALILKEPVPVLLVGEKFETVSQLVLLLTAFHVRFWLAVTLMVLSFAAEVGCHEVFGEIVRVGAAAPCTVNSLSYQATLPYNVADTAILKRWPGVRRDWGMVKLVSDTILPQHTTQHKANPHCPLGRWGLVFLVR